MLFQEFIIIPVKYQDITEIMILDRESALSRNIMKKC